MGAKPRRQPGPLAWHFARADRRLRYSDSREIVVAETLSVPDLSMPLQLCNYGMHASIEPLDALKYAPGPILCRVELSGEVLRGNDKVCAQHRRVLWMADATDTLRAFARRCALDVIDKLDAPDVVRRHLETPDVVRRHLETPDDSIRAAAWDEAEDAAWAAAWAAARDATGAAAWAAARDATWAAAWDAARDAQNKRLRSMLMELANLRGHRGPR